MEMICFSANTDSSFESTSPIVLRMYNFVLDLSYLFLYCFLAGQGSG